MSCAQIESILPTTTWSLEPLEVSLASLFGVILGVILALITSRCFVKELAKSRVQKHTDPKVCMNAVYESRLAGEADMTYRKGTATTLIIEEDGAVPVKRHLQDDDDEEEQEDSGSEDDGGDGQKSGGELEVVTNAGIIIALTKSTSEKTLVELSLQDFYSTRTMEKELLQERESVFIHLLSILLGKFTAMEKLDEAYAEEFVESTAQFLLDEKNTLEGTQVLREEELKKKPELLKDPLLLEAALEESRLEYIRKMDALVPEAQMKVKDKLSKGSQLTAEEIEALMQKLLENLATSEKMIGQEQNRQATILQERLAKRKALSEQYALLNTREDKGNQARTKNLREVAGYLAEERDLNEAQAKSIMKQYEADMAQIQENHQAAVLRQSVQLAEKLQQHRDRKLRGLAKKHNEQREKLAAKAPQVVNPADFVEAHHDLLEQQRNEQNDLIDELDYHEAEELSLLRKQMEEERIKELSEKDNSVLEDLATKAQLNEKDAQRILKKHEANIKAYDEQLDQEKKRQNMILQEKIEQRKAAWEEEQKRVAAEQQQLAEQQERTITKLIDTQAALDEEAKRQILLQHEQNVTALNNHLQLTKLKQQKLLEAKLAKRLARFEALKARQEQERVANGEDGDEDTKLHKQQQEELAAEERAIQEEHQAAILALRKQLAAETERVLKDQDAQLGVLIGKLQVGQARRQGVIKKLDKAVKDLQDQLVDSIADSNVVSERKTERILALHMQQMEEIEDKLRQAREHQEDQLQHKMETIKLMREKTLSSELEKEESKTNRRSSNVALQYMTKILEDNRQKQAMTQLEQEMKVEELRQKDELNRQLEDALEQELKERERDFLGQLAALSQLSKEELGNMVQSAIEEEGGDDADAKRLAKDLNKRIKSAKTRPDFDPDAEEEEADEKPKKKKKGKKSAKE